MSVTGEFLIVYAGQSFVIDVNFFLGSWPSFKSRRLVAIGGCPENFTVKRVNPLCVNGSQATVVFQVTTDQ